MSSRAITVAQHGTANFRTLQQAIDAVQDGETRRTLIRVAPGVYRQPMYVPKKKNLIKLEGISPEATVLTWHNTATKADHHRVHEIGTGTFWSGSVIVEGDYFIAGKITFENSAPQDTLYLDSGKQYLLNCYVEGSVDFICGDSTALLEQCHIHCKSDGFITAQKRETSRETTGYVFLRFLTKYTYIGRPWGPFAKVVMLYTYMDACVKQVGWDNWGHAVYERSVSFYEYKCFGPGSSRLKLVAWSRELTDKEAEPYLPHKFFDPDQQHPWLTEKMP